MNQTARVTTLALLVVLFTSLCFAQGRVRRPSKAPASVPQPQSVLMPGARAAEGDRLAAVDAVLQSSVQTGQIPGAVLIVGHNGEVVYRKAVGWRSLEPSREAMTLDTVFDIASLTKCIATATSLMRMVELGQLRLNDPVAKYIPEFARNGKEDITIRQLATHFSGLREDLDLKSAWNGKETAYAMANLETPVTPPGSQFRYSDINYIVLGEIVERISGMPLDKYAWAHIFDPMGMSHTRFLPGRELGAIAPTEYDERGVMLRGTVHDPTARRMGGVAGHAGVFSTADDLARFAQAMLDVMTSPTLRGAQGRAREFVLSQPALQKMTTPQQPPTATVLRGIGWDLDSPFASNRGELLPMGSFGHTGFTGTSLWIDPTTNTYIVLLTNGVHPRLKPGGAVVSLRTRVASAVAAALELSVGEKDSLRLASVTGYNEAMVGARKLASRNGQVKTGLDVLEERGFDVLRGNDASKPRRIGVVTNQTGLDSRGRRTIDVLAHAPGVELGAILELTAIFSPEHGVTGMLDTTDIKNTKDSATGLPVYSVYGAKDAQRRPPMDVVRSLDAIVFDVQDAGVRFYTYETTLGYFLEAAAQAGVELVVLDRPNPITGSFVQGPVSNSGKESFVNYYTVPVRHGMTLGELARFFNEEKRIGAKLTVISMQGWMRGDWFDSTGLTWTNPSPNLRSLTEATLYPGVALIEGTNVSVGRGTDTPFEVVGAPWIDARKFAEYLNARAIQGVRFVPVNFTPTSSNYAGQRCGGVNMIVTDRFALDSPELGIELASALLKMYPQDYKITRMPELLIHEASFDALLKGQDPRRIADDWREEIEHFMAVRKKYLLY